MRKCLIKFSAVLVALVVALSCFCFTSFGAQTAIEPELTFDGFEVQYIEVTLTSPSGDVVPVNVTCSAGSDSERLTLCISQTNGSCFYKDFYRVSLIFHVSNPVYLTSENYVDVSYDICAYNSHVDPVLLYQYFNCYRSDPTIGSIVNEQGDVNTRSDSTYDYFHFVFANGKLGASYRAYVSNLYFSFQRSDISYLYLFLDNVDFRVLTGAEKSSQKLQSSIDENTDKIVSNQDKNASDIKANQDKNASDIKANQDKNTDTIMNGDEDLDVSDKTGAVNGSLDDMDGATADALRGKSEEEIQSEVSAALDPDKVNIDFDKAGRISWFFDKLLECFGSSYQSVLLLSLTLGLGAFLIGRRYG